MCTAARLVDNIVGLLGFSLAVILGIAQYILIIMAIPPSSVESELMHGNSNQNAGA
jgi:phage shock protein PspC (stress-responsive transcriptional regulator)